MSTIALFSVFATVSGARAADLAEPTVDLSIYGHVGSVVWVVKDLRPGGNLLGKAGLKNIQLRGVTSFAGLVYRGKLGGSDYGTIGGFGNVGGVLIESDPAGDRK